MLANYPRDGVIHHYGVNCPHAYWEGVVARWQGDSAKAQSRLFAARSEVEKTLEKPARLRGRSQPSGVIDAGLGRKDRAFAKADAHANFAHLQGRH